MNTENELTDERIAEETSEVEMTGRTDEAGQIEESGQTEKTGQTEETGQNRFFKWIAAGFPPGAHILIEIIVSAVLLCFLVLGSMRFYQRMDDWKKTSREMQASYDRLKEEAGGGLVEVRWSEGAFKNLDYFLEDCFTAYPLLILWCVFLVILHYVGFYRGSKSVYVMKRLRSKAEMHRRCLLFPMACALIGTAYVWVMIRCFIHIYNNAEIFKTGVDTVSVFGTFL